MTPQIETLLDNFFCLEVQEQAEFLSKIKPKRGVGNALADPCNSISEKDFWGWIDAIYEDYLEGV